jgi:hypothetical protein
MTPTLWANFGAWQVFGYTLLVGRLGCFCPLPSGVAAVGEKSVDIAPAVAGFAAYPLSLTSIDTMQ